MTSDEFHWLLDFLELGDEDQEDQLPGGGEVEVLVAETAVVLTDLREAADDIVGAVVWRQVAEDTVYAVYAPGFEDDRGSN